jgi:hypothetical protein
VTSAFEDQKPSDPPPPAQKPGGLEAPLAPSADPTRKTDHTSDLE